MSEKINDPEVIIQFAIDDMVSLLFVVICNCYPELATTEFESVFHEEFKSHVIIFINAYFKSINKGTELKIIKKGFCQACSTQLFFEKLALAIERSNQIKVKLNEKDLKSCNENKR